MCLLKPNPFSTHTHLFHQWFISHLVTTSHHSIVSTCSNLNFFHKNLFTRRTVLSLVRVQLHLIFLQQQLLCYLLFTNNVSRAVTTIALSLFPMYPLFMYCNRIVYWRLLWQDINGIPLFKLPTISNIHSIPNYSYHSRL